MKTDSDYFNYLSTRSFLGFIYRRFWLYPKLCMRLQGKTLDVGCGIGDFLAFRPSTLGIDINLKAVEFCKNKGLPVKLMYGNLIPFPKHFFDSVILDNVLEHVEDPIPLLLEISRVLKNNGTFVVGVPGKRGFKSDLDHKVFYPKSKLITTLSKAGFHCTEIFYMPLPISALSNVVKSFCIYGRFKKVSE